MGGHNNKVVFITGGTRGIGRRIAERFLAEGAQVIVCGRSKPEHPPSHNGRPAQCL